MKRTEFLQETWKMRFEEAYEVVKVDVLRKQKLLCYLVGVCDSIFRRYIGKSDKNGLDALMDKRFT